jgi:uncharacterized protein (DUF2345 family)
MFFNGIDDPDSAWLANSNSENRVKAIRTRNGHTIEIHDNYEGGYIRIYDNNKENYVLTLSTDDQLIKLESKGNIELRADKNIIMRAGHSIKVKAGSNIKTEAGKDITTKAEENFYNKSGKDYGAWAQGEMVYATDCNLTIHAEEDFRLAATNYQTEMSENYQLNVEGDSKTVIEGDSTLSANNISLDANNGFQVESMTNNQKATATMALDAKGDMNIKGAICKVN